MKNFFIIKHSDCPEFNVSNGKVIVRLNITNHLIVEIKCNTGYNIEGNQLNRCINGKWESPNVTCKGTHVILKQCSYVCMYACMLHT